MSTDTDEWIKKVWRIYTSEYIISHQKESNNAILVNKDGPKDYPYLREVKRKTNPTYHLHVNWVRHKSNCKIKMTDRVTGVEMTESLGMKDMKPLYIRWINNKVLLYSTELIFLLILCETTAEEWRKNVCMCVHVYMYIYN